MYWECDILSLLLLSLLLSLYIIIIITNTEDFHYMTDVFQHNLNALYGSVILPSLLQIFVHLHTMSE